MISYSIEQLMPFINNGVLLINEQIARVFIRGNCCYFEDLPGSIQNSDLLFCYIATQLDMCEQDRTKSEYCHQKAQELYKILQNNNLSEEIKQLKSSLYIQVNKELTNAIIITSNNKDNILIIDKWISMNFVNISGQFKYKTKNISYKLIVKSIPKKLSKEILINHKQFQNCVKTIDIIGENAIIELNDKRVWEECLKTGSLQIDYIIRHIML
ncbi:unnamed protein product, partial [Didymodactylos carnosus]